jgi:benzodiazapine receptor
MASPKRSYLLLAVFVVLVFCAAAGGWFFKPGAWYAEIWKPSWTPPNWAFPVVWPVLYVCIAIAGWLIFSQPGTVHARVLWAVQLVLNGIWTWIFFGLRQPMLALADIAALLACIAALMVVSWRRQRAVSWLFLPYFVWVAYASALTGAIAFGNP